MHAVSLLDVALEPKGKLDDTSLAPRNGLNKTLSSLAEAAWYTYVHVCFCILESLQHW